MSTPSTLVFERTVFDVVDRDGQPWLRAAQIAQALGYSRADRISEIYRRHADEFTQAMTETVNLTVSGNLQKTERIFSPRGAHLLGMFAHTAKAAEFRRWVLEGKAAPARPPRPQRPEARPAAAQGDLFETAALPQAALAELALLRQLQATQARLVQLLEERLRPKKRARRPQLTLEEIRRARRLHAQGMSNADIARHMGRSPATIGLLLRDLH